MGNGAMPNGPSYRAHPRLYLSGHSRHRNILSAIGQELTFADRATTLMSPLPAQ
jgi:hypothetical protein